jgi:hypothetical protein
VVSGDTEVGHLATAYGTCRSWFGRTPPGRSAAYRRQHRVIYGTETPIADIEVGGHQTDPRSEEDRSPSKESTVGGDVGGLTVNGLVKPA